MARLTYVGMADGRPDDWPEATVMGAAVTTCAVGRVGIRETLGSRNGREVTEEPLQLRATRARALPGRGTAVAEVAVAAVVAVLGVAVATGPKGGRPFREIPRWDMATAGKGARTSAAIGDRGVPLLLCGGA